MFTGTSHYCLLEVSFFGSRCVFSSKQSIKFLETAILSSRLLRFSDPDLMDAADPFGGLRVEGDCRLVCEFGHVTDSGRRLSRTTSSVCRALPAAELLLELPLSLSLMSLVNPEDVTGAWFSLLLFEFAFFFVFEFAEHWLLSSDFRRKDSHISCVAPSL